MRTIIWEIDHDVTIRYGHAGAGADTPPEIEYRQTIYGVAQIFTTKDCADDIRWNADDARKELREFAEDGETEWSDHFSMFTIRDTIPVSGIDFKPGDIGGIVRFVTITSNDPIK